SIHVGEVEVVGLIGLRIPLPVDRPAFRAVLSGRRRSDGDFAFATVEAGDDRVLAPGTTAVVICPDHAVLVDVQAMTALYWRGVLFRPRRLRGIRPQRDALDRRARAPHAAIERADARLIAPELAPSVPGRISRLVRL